MSKYKLLEDAGLKVRGANVQQGYQCHTYTNVVLADDLLRWLESAPVVYGRIDEDQQWSPQFQQGDDEYYADTHQARLVCISPIQKDTAESLLREFVGLAEMNKPEGWSLKLTDAVKRARKLFEGKDCCGK